MHPSGSPIELTAPLPARRLRHRVMAGGEWVFGPGKADLLAAIQERGSLAGAARSLGMSYMRAWELVQRMQSLFAAPAVALRRGGKQNGGATLTETGVQALALYRSMEEEALAATEETWAAFCKLLRPAHGERPPRGKKRGTPP